MNNRLREISKISRNITIYKNSLSAYELTDNYYEALRLIVKHPGTNSNYLSERMCVDKGLISRIMRSLSQNGYISLQNCERDKRQTLLYPTEKGIELKTKNETEDNKFYDYIEKIIPEDKKDAFFDVLEILYSKSKELRHESFKDLKQNEKITKN